MVVGIVRRAKVIMYRGYYKNYRFFFIIDIREALSFFGRRLGGYFGFLIFKYILVYFILLEFEVLR